MKQFVLSAFIFVLSALFNINECWASDLSLAPAAARKTYIARSSSTAKAFISVTSFGRDVANSFNYTITSDKGTVVEGTYTFKEAFRKYDTSTCEIEFPVNKVTDITSLTFSIDKVNNERNGATLGSCNIPFTFISKFATRKVVVEDFTGMWCGWCPRGIAAMEYMQKHYPESFIGIAAHDGDVLSTPDYAYVLATYRGRPYVLMNRTTRINSFVPKSELERERDAGADMDVDISAVWDEGKNKISITSTTTFRIDASEGNYALAYVLTEDGMTSSYWGQNNNFAGDMTLKGVSEEAEFFMNNYQTVYNMKNNHVAIAAKHITNGLEGVVKAPFVADKPIVHETSFDNIAQYRNIQNKDNLSVCVLLIDKSKRKIDKSEGKIVNANKCKIQTANATGIESTTIDNKEKHVVARYTINGEFISAPVKGINIVKYSDGTTKKEVVQ